MEYQFLKMYHYGIGRNYQKWVQSYLKGLYHRRAFAVCLQIDPEYARRRQRGPACDFEGQTERTFAIPFW